MMHHRQARGLRLRPTNLRVEFLEDRQLLSISPNSASVELADDHEHGVIHSLPAEVFSNSESDALVSSAVTAASPLTSIPVLNSFPGAKSTVFLDFDGSFTATWYTSPSISYTNITTPVFSLDNDFATFSDQELDVIRRIWESVAEDYAPFNVNVTTVEPPSFADGVAVHVAIGGAGDWYDLAGGVALLGSFTDSTLSNTVFVFPDNLRITSIAEAAAHEAGHAFGLEHQSEYSGATLVNEYYAGPGDGRAPIMGNSYRATRSLWWQGTSTSATTIQDDLSVLSNSTNAFGYRTDDHGGTTATATPINTTISSFSSSGIIAQTTDADYFRFVTTAGNVSFAASTIASYANLDIKLELRDATGALIATADPSNSVNASITANVAAGTYYVVVTSHGSYGDIGQYTITGNINVDPPQPQADKFVVFAGAPTPLNVLLNDLAGAAGTQLVPSTLTIVTPPANGSYSIDPTTGIITYTSNSSFVGTDRFTYTVRDSLGQVSAETEVLVTVNSIPIAINDLIELEVGQTIAADVVANDLDSPGDLVNPILEIIKTPDRGTYQVEGGVITYTPQPGFAGGDTLTYRVIDTIGGSSNVATVTFLVGPQSSLSGLVYHDANGNGKYDPTEQPMAGVSVWIDKTDGPFTYRDVFVTEADGTYRFNQLVYGTYTVRESQPGFYQDGRETVGTLLTPGSVRNDRFVDLVINSQVNATGYNFGELGMYSQFLTAYLNRQAFSASAGGNSFANINLLRGDAWVALSGDTGGQFQAFAMATGGSVNLTMYNDSMQIVSRSSIYSPSLDFKMVEGQTYFVKLSGTSTNVELQALLSLAEPSSNPPPSTTPVTPPVAPERGWTNPTNPFDVNNDGSVKSSDLVAVVKQLKSQGVATLIGNNTTSYYYDVNADGRLTSADIVAIVKHLKTNAAATKAATAVTPPQAALVSDTALVTTQPVAVAAANSNSTVSAAALAQAMSAPRASSTSIALALAVDDVMETFGKVGKRRI